MIMMLTSIDDKHKAQELAHGLLQAKLAACVQISAKGMSMYMWQGDICQDEEYYLSIKTDAQYAKSVQQWLEKHHPYETPEIIRLQGKASAKYANWLQTTLNTD